MLWPYNDDSSAATTFATPAASSATAGLMKARSMVASSWPWASGDRRRVAGAAHHSIRMKEGRLASGWRHRAGRRATAGPAQRPEALRDDRDDQDRDDVRDLDHRVDRGAGGVLERIAHRVARDRGGVGLRTLAAVGAVLDEILRVVPRAAAGGHEDGEEEADHDDADQQAAERLDAQHADDERDQDRDQRRDYHLPLRRLRHEIHARVVVGLLGALHDPRLLAELAADLLDDRAAGAADRLHRESGEQADHEAAEEEAHEDRRGGDRAQDAPPLPPEVGLEAREEHQHRDA